MVGNGWHAVGKGLATFGNGWQSRLGCRLAAVGKTFFYLRLQFATYSPFTPAHPAAMTSFLYFDQVPASALWWVRSPLLGSSRPMRTASDRHKVSVVRPDGVPGGCDRHSALIRASWNFRPIGDG